MLSNTTNVKQARVVCTFCYITASKTAQISWLPKSITICPILLETDLLIMIGTEMMCIMHCRSTACYTLVDLRIALIRCDIYTLNQHAVGSLFT